MKKLPPKQKVYEALSAIADNRVTMGETSATVRSSNGEKEYMIDWSNGKYRSDDNATYWQGYAGYPVIAVLMLQGRISDGGDLGGLLAGIDWNALNKTAKRDYDKAAETAFEQAGITEEKRVSLRGFADEVVAELDDLDAEVGRYKAK